jgi:hypothetical protein
VPGAFGMLKDNIRIIARYLGGESRKSELGSFYVKCLEAMCRYCDTGMDYYFTDEDYDNFLMLASAWSAIMRKAWRIFVAEGDCEPFEYWNAFIQSFMLEQTILLNDQLWNMKYHKKLKEKINKTSNPKFIEKMFTGMNWDWLHKELQKGNLEC